jgi:ribosome biogenesis protein ERB1
MAAKASDRAEKKRKEVPVEPVEKGPFADAVGLEMSSNEEEGQFDSGSDDGEVDEFPGIDMGGDSGSDGSDADEDREEISSEDEEDDIENDSDLQIFPKAKTIVSDITGQQKRVYPEIEPEYDSDSSTEDVRYVPTSVHLAFLQHFDTTSDSKSCRKCAHALVR